MFTLPLWTAQRWVLVKVADLYRDVQCLIKVMYPLGNSNDTEKVGRESSGCQRGVEAVVAQRVEHLPIHGVPAVLNALLQHGGDPCRFRKHGVDERVRDDLLQRVSRRYNASHNVSLIVTYATTDRQDRPGAPRRAPQGKESTNKGRSLPRRDGTMRHTSLSLIAFPFLGEEYINTT